MSKYLRWRYAFALVFLGAIVVILIFYTKYKPITSWDSPRMLKIQKKWQSVWDTFYKITPQGKQLYKYANAVEMAKKVLNQHISDADLRRLAAALETTPDAVFEKNDFNWAVLKFMVVRFVDSGDRDNLVKTLAIHFPDRVHFYVTTESYLATNGQNLPNAMQVLADAYAKCNKPAVRRHIAIAVRRAFAPSGVTGKDDDEFINNAMQWYEKNKEHLKPNNKYWENTFFGEEYNEVNPYYQTAPYEKGEPLFVEKSSP